MNYRMKFSIASAAVLVFVLAIHPVDAQHGHAEGMSSGHRHHQRFDDPEKWSKSFDDPARDSWQRPDDVIRSLAPNADARIADIGAGTGYFTVRLARSVPRGIVFAVDIERKMVEHIAARAKEVGLSNVRGVVAGETSARLPEPVDLVLLVNVYHHIEKRMDYMRDLASSLRRGGRVAIIEARPDAEQGPPKHFRLAVTRIDEEMAAAGYRRIAQRDFLPRQNFLVYERSDR
jgi:SAM-dependent methyltransferase